jgi:hypothetical protein
MIVHDSSGVNHVMIVLFVRAKLLFIFGKNGFAGTYSGIIFSYVTKASAGVRFTRSATFLWGPTEIRRAISAFAILSDCYQSPLPLWYGIVSERCTSGTCRHLFQVSDLPTKPTADKVECEEFLLRPHLKRSERSTYFQFLSLVDAVLIVSDVVSVSHFEQLINVGLLRGIGHFSWRASTDDEESATRNRIFSYSKMLNRIVEIWNRTSE